MTLNVNKEKLTILDVQFDNYEGTLMQFGMP